jgi:hypothetical protein
MDGFFAPRPTDWRRCAGTFTRCNWMHKFATFVYTDLCPGNGPGEGSLAINAAKESRIPREQLAETAPVSSKPTDLIIALAVVLYFANYRPDGVVRLPLECHSSTPGNRLNLLFEQTSGESCST